MKGTLGLIVGTGASTIIGAMPGRAFSMPTSHGWVHGRYVTIEGISFALFQRHAAGHRVPPHRVNYLGVAEGCRNLGLRGVLATAAVGSLRSDWSPGTLVACSDFVDLTFRRLTAFHGAIHTDFSHPFDTHLTKCLSESGDVVHGGVYGGGDGPRYETPAEIRMLKTLGVDVVGMTASSEAIAMRENGVPYACLAIVTNLAAGVSSSPLSHEEVVAEMSQSGQRALNVLVASSKRFLGL